MNYDEFKAAIRGAKTGTKVTCKIEGTVIDDAKLSIDPNGDVYICQNKESGRDAHDKLGYKYSYMVDSDCSVGEVSDLKVLGRDLNYLYEGDIIYNRGSERTVLYSFPTKEGIYVLSEDEKFDVVEAIFSAKELKRNDYKIKETPKELPEFTVEELTEKLGYNFKIKK